MEKVCNDIQHVFDTASKETFGVRRMLKSKRRRKITGEKLNRKHKTLYFFNSKCEEKRSIFHRSKKLYSITKSSADLAKMKSNGKAYKQELRSAYNKHSKNIRREVKELRKNKHMKEYWAFIGKKEKNKFNELDENNMHTFFNFFKGLNSRSDNDFDTPVGSPPSNSELDSPIMKEEIMNCVKRLKNNKASGIDNILNEFLKASKDLMIDIYVSLFNLVFTTGDIPYTWTIGNINPIYKNKGDINNPDNYRPITLLSCLGKLFTAIINERLKKYSENNNIIGEEQLGFRNGYSTIDGAFILHALISLMEKRNKSTYAVFIDLKKAFPSISRPLLFQKLSELPIGTNIFKCIKSMYDNIKSCVTINGRISELFSCQVGLREGECLSPILFSFYLNDLKDHLILNSEGISLKHNAHGIDQLFNLFIIMYADDTVLFADSRAKLQQILNCYIEYCEKWKLYINPEKTKVMIFRKNYSKPNIKVYGKNLEVVNHFKYLGNTFSKNGRFMFSLKDNIDKARKGFYALMNHCKDKFIPLDCKLELFSKCIEPILLYGCEIWGTEDIAILEKIRMKCYKIIMKAKSSTPAYMIYGELGLLPLSYFIQKRMISYWFKVNNSDPKTLARQLYDIMFNDYEINEFPLKWLETISKSLHLSGLGYLWALQNNIRDVDKKLIYTRLKDISLQNLIETCRLSKR